MTITLFSSIMGLIYFFVGTLLLYFLRNRVEFIKIYGVNLLVFFAAGCVARVLIPVELPNTYIIKSRHIYPQIMRILKLPIIEVKQASINWNLLSILFALSITISIVIFFCHIKDYIKIYRCLARLKPEVNELVESLLKKIAGELGIKHIPQVIQNKEISSPKIIGFYKPIIFMSMYTYSEKELYLIILHEMIHYKNKDVWIKLIVNMVSILLWWNPFVYLLKKDLCQLLEIRCDLEICKGLNIEEKAEYLQTIIRILENQNSEYDRLTHSYYSSELIDKYKKECYLEQRFNIVLLDDNSKNKKIVGTFIIFAFIAALVLSYMNVIQPHTEPDKTGYYSSGDNCCNENLVIVDAENSYIIYEDNIYMLFVNDVFMFVIQESEIDDFKLIGIPIYM